ncbi:cysteine desulfurase [Clostridiales bacterium COT073_COT-073]|nr:cysteine desulfurase [Clostridiales bacterium COT073_COT-073]
MLEIDKIRDDFPILKQTRTDKPFIFLDNSATTLKPWHVQNAICNYYEHYSANALRGDYDQSYFVDKKIEEARKKICQFIGAEFVDEIIFTSGATEALNLAAFGYGKFHLKAGDIILTTIAEHASCLLPWIKVAQETSATINWIPLDETGRLNINKMKQMLNDKVKFIVLAHVTNVLGYLSPIKEICQLAHQKNIIVVVDGAQSISQHDINVQDLDCDFFAFSGHKICGPTGIGVLYGKAKLLKEMMPLHWGGGSNIFYDMHGEIQLKRSPYKFESGTLALEAIFGFSEAIDYLENIGIKEIYHHVMELKRYAVKEMKKMPNIILYNSEADSGIITFNVKGIFAGDVAKYFNNHGICIRSGEHCTKLLHSHLNTLSTLRASIYFYNTKNEIDIFLNACQNATKENCYKIIFANSSLLK